MSAVTYQWTDASGLTVYAYPINQSLADWVTHRIQLVELASPNLGKYEGELTNTVEWLLFYGAAQPSDWDAAIARVDLSSGGVGSSTDAQTTISRNLFEEVPIRFTHPAASVTFTSKNKRINYGSSSPIDATVTFLFTDTNGDHWYELGYSADDRPTDPGTVHYSFSDGTYNTSVSVYFTLTNRFEAW